MGITVSHDIASHTLRMAYWIEERELVNALDPTFILRCAQAKIGEALGEHIVKELTPFIEGALISYGLMKSQKACGNGTKKA